MIVRCADAENRVNKKSTRAAPRRRHAGLRAHRQRTQDCREDGWLRLPHAKICQLIVSERTGKPIGALHNAVHSNTPAGWGCDLSRPCAIHSCDALTPNLSLSAICEGDHTSRAHPAVQSDAVAFISGAGSWPI